MLNKKETTSILLIILILAFTLSFTESLKIFLYALLTIFLIIMINVVAKKIASFYLGTKIEVGIWEIGRYGYKKHWHFKRPFPAGVFFPIIITILSLGSLTWMASLVFLM